MKPKPWTTTSWLNCPNPQALVYQDQASLQAVLMQLSQQKPLVSAGSILKLKQTLAQASMGHAFILQGGNCAESFQDCRPSMIRGHLRLMQQMVHLIQPTLKKPVVLVGRIAGQYAKPRSFAYETRSNLTLLSYRGDLINASPFNEKAREPNPQLLLKGYHAAKYTLRLIQALQKNSPFYTSHEALHLHYETALTRQCHHGFWYNFSTHLPWIGIRTTQLDGAHVEFLRGIENPTGIKIGPNTTPEALLKLIDILNPKKEAGRILLITRLGAQSVASILPGLIQAVQSEKLPVTWSCDPMHGNTEVTQEGIKTRHTNNIWQELKQTYFIHQTHQSHLSGIHLEITPDAVTECLGGVGGPSELELKKAYKSLLDPRLNPTQSLELSKKFAQLIGP